MARMEMIEVHRDDDGELLGYVEPTRSGPRPVALTGAAAAGLRRRLR